MKIIILNKKHLTAGDRKDLKTMFDNNWSVASTKMKNYRLAKLPDGSYSLSISRKYTATIGDLPRWHDDPPVIFTAVFENESNQSLNQVSLY